MVSVSASAALAPLFPDAAERAVHDHRIVEDHEVRVEHPRARFSQVLGQPVPESLDLPLRLLESRDEAPHLVLDPLGRNRDLVDARSLRVEDEDAPDGDPG